MPVEDIDALAASLRDELTRNILPFWSRYRDTKNGGYFGHIHNDGTAVADAPKGLVMHTRLLWTYSQALIDGFPESADKNGTPVSHREQAEHAFAFLRDRLHDEKNGGFHWLAPANHPNLPEAKIVYGQAFAVYAMSAWYRASGESDALTLAADTFALIEKTARDRVHGGYWEGVAQDWSAPSAASLGAEDPRVEKSMNTNLHVMEAWTGLHQALEAAQGRTTTHSIAGPELLSALEESLASIIHIHVDRIRVRPGHLGMFFNRDWTGRHPVESYGHDVEASWLIAEAAEELWGRDVPPNVVECIVELGREGARILDLNGGSMPNEAHGAAVDRDRIWWVQAESMVAMINLWQMTGNKSHIDRAAAIWNYIQRHIVDHKNGEWFWGRKADGQVMPGREKGGMWKANYHNGRACMEIIRRAVRHAAAYL